MVDQRSSYETLQGYFQLDTATRRKDFKASMQDDKIHAAITPKVITLDIANPLYQEHLFHLNPSDSIEVKAKHYSH